MANQKQKNEPAQIPSDALFKKIMEDIVAAKDFLEYYLPDDFKCLIDLTKIKLEKESYVEENLKRSLSDLVYSVQTKDNEKAFVYILIEAQSKPDYWMALRLWKYMLLLCERHKDKSKNKLPLIVPILFYNGTTRYNVPMNLWELFTIPEQAKKIMTKDYKLIDLHSMNNDEMKKKHYLGMMEYFMKHIHQRDMLKLWQDFLEKFSQTIFIDQEKGEIYIKHFLWYTDARVPEDHQQELGELIVKHLSSEGENIMRSIAQKYIDEGLQKGITEGITKSKIEIAKKMLTRGKPVNEIIDFTGLSVREIMILKTNP